MGNLHARDDIGLAKQLDHKMLGITFFCSRPGPPVPQLLREGISESQAKSLVDSYTPMVNRGLGGCCTCKRCCGSFCLACGRC